MFMPADYYGFSFLTHTSFIFEITYKNDLKLLWISNAVTKLKALIVVKNSCSFQSATSQ